jgi:bifunctional non-homologous end joining protein LigD
MTTASPVAADFVEPMKARLGTELPHDNGWLFELKLDGIRALGVRNGSETKLFSRRPRELTADFPEIAAALADLRATQFIVDGEIVAFDPDGRTSFQLLQNRKRNGSRAGIFFILFDLLQLNGRDLTSLPLIQRRAALEKLLHGPRPVLRFSSAIHGEPADIWRNVRKLGLEGIVAKRRDSKYEPGRRSGAWIKVKTRHEQEFVIGGYTAPQGGREYFGAVLVGYHSGKELLFASKVGTGFDSAALQSLHETFSRLKTPDCPFANLPTRRDGQYGQGITRGEMSRCTWLKPKLVCEVRFLEWTRDGNLRQPVFLGLREDVKPEKVIREEPG